MSFRFKLLSWIVAINIGITSLLLVAVLSNIHQQSKGYERNAERSAEQRGEIFQRLGDILDFQKSMSEKKLADIRPGDIIKWREWDLCRDAMVLLHYTELDGEIVSEDILINPLGKLHRAFDDEKARSILERAITKDQLVLRLSGN